MIIISILLLMTLLLTLSSPLINIRGDICGFLNIVLPNDPVVPEYFCFAV